MADLPLIDIKDITLYTGTLPAKAEFVMLLGNTTTARVPLASIVTTNVVKTSAPSSPADSGSTTSIAWGSDGVYTFADGLWGKSPRFTVNWDDFKPDSRFVSASHSQNLSAEEKSIAMANLGISNATSSNTGLVHLATSMDDNTGGVPTAGVIKQWVEEKLRDIAISPGTGSSDIANYRGHVHLLGPAGEKILYYDAVNKILTIGDDVDIIKLPPNESIEILNADDEIKSRFVTED